MKQSKTMELKKPVRVSLARQVLTAMESMIRSGKWKVGDRIPAEAELARAFSVSHNTIREALQSLIHMGMLEARPGDGTYVMASDRFAVAVSNRLKESELPQILEARLALEKEIARLASVKRTTCCFMPPWLALRIIRCSRNCITWSSAMCRRIWKGCFRRSNTTPAP